MILKLKKEMIVIMKQIKDYVPFHIILADLQIHFLQQDDEPIVRDSGSLRQGHGRIHSHVLHCLLGFLPIGLLGFRNPGIRDEVDYVVVESRAFAKSR